MDTTTFLQSVTGTDGYYSILALGPRKGQRVQKFYPSAEAVQVAAEEFDEAGRDTYFALGRFATDDSREAANVTQMRALFLDLDCGEGKPFADQPEALTALRKFVRSVALPKPMVINSGRGLHVYWPLTEPVPVATWLPVAQSLKAACSELGLEIDPSVTTDAARVLRVPGTNNYKDSTPKGVSILTLATPTPLELLSATLADYAPSVATTAGLFSGTMPTNISAETQREMGAVMTALLGNKEASFKKIAKRSAAGTGCGQIALMLASPEDVPEPLWRAGLSVAYRCTEKKAVQWLSQGHPDYDERDSLRKAAATKGPYTCVSFDNENPGVCQKCPHWGKIKSPIVLGHVLVEAEENEEVEIAPAPAPAPVALRTTTASGTVTIPKYPFPYKRGANGGVYVRSKDDDGNEEDKLIWVNDLYVVRRLTDPEQGEVVEMRHHLPRDGVRSFVVPLTSVTSKEEFRKAISAQGVAAINKEVDILMTYTQTWIAELQHSTTADHAHRQFGWIGDFEGFVLGDHVITPAGTEYNAPSSGTRNLTEMFEPKGTLEGWKEAINFYNRPGFELHQFVVCSGFGSILMKFLPIHAALIHLWSKDSGFGKTTVLQAASSIWANPTQMVMDENDTFNSKMNRADVMHSLPMCMDEITNIRPVDGSQLIYQITGGRQRNRLMASGNTERWRGDPWNLIFLSTANCSLIDKVSVAKAMPKAEAQRVLEIEVSKMFHEQSDKELTDKFSRDLLDNYGHAGPEFVRYVIDNIDSVNALVHTTMGQIDRLANLRAENRFWSAVSASTIAAAVICRHLGLIDYDVRALRDYTINRILRDNQLTSGGMETDGMSLIGEYVYENWGRILQIKSTGESAGHGNGLDGLVVPEQMPRGTDLVGRYETDRKRIFLLNRPLREWCSDRQINFNSLCDEIRTLHGGKRLRTRLTKGTAMVLPAAEVLEVPLDLTSTEKDAEDK